MRLVCLPAHVGSVPTRRRLATSTSVNFVKARRAALCLPAAVQAFKKGMDGHTGEHAGVVAQKSVSAKDIKRPVHKS